MLFKKDIYERILLCQRFYIYMFLSFSHLTKIISTLKNIPVTSDSLISNNEMDFHNTKITQNSSCAFIKYNVFNTVSTDLDFN